MPGLMFYEALGLGEGHRFMEVGTGSGYGAALAREVTGRGGLAVSVEIDPVTLAFATANLNRRRCWSSSKSANRFDSTLALSASPECGAYLT